MRLLKALAAIPVMLALYPFIGLGWLAGVIAYALEAGWFHGQTYIQRVSTAKWD